MKNLRLSFMVVSMFLSACSYATPSSPTTTVQAPLIVPTSKQVSTTALLLPLPSETVTPPPTPTSGLVMSIVPDTTQAQAQACGQSPNWAAYTVQRSDTLSSLAQRTGTSVQQIQAANCLTGTLIFAGQILYLPFVPPPQTAVSNPTWTPSVGLPGHYTIEPSPRNGPPSNTFTFSVNRYASNEPVHVTITFRGAAVQDETFPADQDGKLTWKFESPADAIPGNYNVFASGTATERIGTGSFTIHAPQPPSTTYP